jgi:hypothetical protein
MTSHRLLASAVALAVAAALAAVAAGCSVNANVGATIGPPGPCTTNGALSCISGAYGWTCPANYNPEDQEAGLSCSVPQPNGPNDDFCCFQWTYGSSCTPDNSLVCAAGSFGYVCAAGDDPSTLDPTLTCSAPTVDGPNDDFCCY